MRPFAPARLLANPHVQTAVGQYARRDRVRWRREDWTTPDGDLLQIDFGPAPSPDAPRCLVIHGLGGSTDSGYVRGMATALLEQGVATVAMNCRASGGRPNKARRLYHAGETGDPRFVLEELRRRRPGPLGAVGYSLGGSMLLNLLAEPDAPELTAAVAVSAPLDLELAARMLERGIGRFYSWYLLRSLKRLLRQRPDLGGEGVDLARAFAARTIRQYDDALIAPLHGFASAEDYYARCSAGPKLGAVQSPCLVLRAADDPFLDPGDLRHLDGAPVEALVSERGGHVGFIDEHGRAWSEPTAAQWLADRLQETAARAT